MRESVNEPNISILRLKLSVKNSSNGRAENFISSLTDNWKSQFPIQCSISYFSRALRRLPTATVWYHWSRFHEKFRKYQFFYLADLIFHCSLCALLGRLKTKPIECLLRGSSTNCVWQFKTTKNSTAQLRHLDWWRWKASNSVFNPTNPSLLSYSRLLIDRYVVL